MGSEKYNILKVELSGSPYEIGHQHGRALAPQIIDQLDIYCALFEETCKFDWATVRGVAAEFQASIARLAPHLLEEIRGIADGVTAAPAEHRSPHFAHANGDAAVDVLDIIALNARSEIALGQWDDGCTALAWTVRAGAGAGATPPGGPRKQLLGQNWDWREAVGKNLALASIAAPGKPRIWMVIEPGIVGKIGFNAASVGVCLNAIRARPISTALLPIHLLLRAALECPSVSAAIAAIEALGGAASSQHILIADRDGARGLELSPRGGVYLAPDADGLLVHTNHFLENTLVDEPPWLSGSPFRLARARELCGDIARDAREGGLGDVGAGVLRARVFADTTNAPQAICCSPDPKRTARIETLFNIVMTFETGREPAAEVVFGKPGSGEESDVYRMPW